MNCSVSSRTIKLDVTCAFFPFTCNSNMDHGFVCAVPLYAYTPSPHPESTILVTPGLFKFANNLEGSLSLIC